MRTSSCRATAPTGFICAFFATIIGFALIWHIWWLVDRRRRRRLCDIRCVRLARPHRGSHPGRRSSAHRRGQAVLMSGRRAATVAASGDGAQRASHRGGAGRAAKRIVVGYGFWIFLLSDIIMFSAFFATYAVLSGATAGGPSGHELFDLDNIAIETALPAAFQLYLRPGDAWRPGAPRRLVL